ncbi:MAG: hypothetical protein IIC73_06235 [Armatimonadetes bacterium]|nr:hypothetical protein [Armatimonadota bacterium]
MSCIVATLTLLAGQGQDPLPRYADLAERSNQLTVEFTVSRRGLGTSGNGTLELSAPNMQLFSMKWQGEAFEFRHSRLGGLAIRHDWKEYNETQAYPVNLRPPPSMAGLADIGYPFILLSPDLKSFVGGAEWESQGTETIRGAACDKLHAAVRAQMDAENTVWIDQEGRIRRWRRQVATATGPVDITFDFTRYESRAPTRVSHYGPALPLGYVPTEVPGPRTRTRMVGLDPAAFGNWLNSRTGEHDDVAQFASGLRVALVFTAPECAISNRIEPFLRILRKRLKAFDCALVEVSLGSQGPELAGKDKDRPVYWDKLGSIERAYGIPATPYFLVADESGRLIRGWQGHTTEMEDRIVETLIAGFVKG